jgi:putative hydrolase of the HAD superfamily
MEDLSRIHTVTFDAGGTLIRPWPSVGFIYAEVAARHGVMVEPDVLNRGFAAAWRKLGAFNHGREEWAALVDESFGDAASEPPSRTFFPEIYDRFAEASAWRIFEDVLPALDALAARGLNLGIISNWDERLLPLLGRLGLAKYFEAIIVSCDVGFTKPSPVIYEHAAKKLGAGPGTALHVGDSFSADVEGARKAGFAALLLDRGRKQEGEGTIGSLREVDYLFPP